MGNGPGSLQDYQRIMASHDRICGGFVWEWIDHGFNAHAEDGSAFILHGEDVDYEPSGGRFSLHGLVFSDRTPTPGLVELAKAYAPVQIAVLDDIAIENDRHAADTSDLRFAWRLEDDGVEVAGGALDVPVVAAGAGVRVPDSCGGDLRPPMGIGGRTRVLTVEATTAADSAWAPAGHLVAWGQSVPAEPGSPAEPMRDASSPGSGEPPAVVVGAGGATAIDPAPARVAVGPAVFDPSTGRLVRLGALELDGPWLDVHRAPTENDHGQGSVNDIASVWAATGLGRMLHRTDRVEHGDGWVRVEGRTAPTTHPHGVEWAMRWDADGDAVVLHAQVDFVGPWADTPYQHRDIWVPRIGLRFSLPGALGHVEWFGRGPGETYVDSYEGSQIGRFSASIDRLQTPYPVPQENGNHVQTRWLSITGDGVAALRVEGRPVFDFTARRWTSHDLERAGKPDDLRDSGRVWLNLDHAQQGLGSASVGPALPERYRIPRERTTWSVRLSTDAALT